MKKRIETKFGEVTSERAALPFYGMVSDLEYADLIRFRIQVREKCLEDHSFRESVVQMCAQDVCFFAATFAVFHETRRTEARQGAFPVDLDPDQADILACLQKYGGLQDIAIDKSRGIGLSYLACVYLLWVWLFHPGGSMECGLLSKDEDALDIKNRPTSLMGKLDLLFSALPEWMKVDDRGKPLLKRTVTDHKFENLANGNSIQGFVPTDDKLRSSRLFCLIADESAFLPFDSQRWLASAHGTTPSIIYVSTHDGTGNMFYRLTQNNTAELIRITTWWYENRRCRRGLYRSVGGQIEILDKDYKFPPDYPFSHEHAPLLRSPWADRAFNRPGADPVSVLQELYGIAVVNLKKLFQKGTLETASRSLAGPTWRGTYTTEGEFMEEFDNAPLFVFRPLERFSTGRYIIGCDPSNGVPGGAFSALSAVDIATGEQVMSGLFEGCDAVRLAKIAAMLSKFLSNDYGRCRIAYESTGGVGAAFKNELDRLKFPESFTLPAHNRDRGESWLLEMSRAIKNYDLVLRDRRVFDEFKHFSYDANGRLAYDGMEGHGDGSIALSLAWQLALKFVRPADVPSRYKTEIEQEPKLRAQKRAAASWSNRFSDVA